MKCSFCISLLSCCLLGLAACTGPVIVEDESSEAGTGQDTPHMRDSVPIIHKGTIDSPYSIGEAQTLGRGKEVWVEGYIVGCVSGSMKNGCDFTGRANTMSNILLADTFLTGDESDYLYCLPLELPAGSIERDDLNLFDNPVNYHRKVRLQGDITLYYRVVGMKEVMDYIFVDEMIPEEPGEDEDDSKSEEETNGSEEPDTPRDPDATRQDTLSIAEGIKLQSDREYNHVYIKGYIIGYTTTNQKIYYNLDNIGETARTNVVLADDIEETDCNKMIAVELEGDSYIQQTVNLIDNPQNLHKCLTVKGAMKEYRKLHGCIDIPDGLKQGNDIIKDYYFLLEQQ